MICDWCHNFHYNHLNLPSSYIPSEYGIKCSSLVYGCFSFRVGNLQSHCKESNYFHQIAKDVFPSEYGIKCSSLVYGCFSFRVGNLQSHCKESNYFHQIAKDVSLLSMVSNAAHWYMAVFHFMLGICKVTVKNQTIFTK